MRVFVTGATGFIGSALTNELIATGHQVIGLCRSAEKAPALAASGAEVYQGSLENVDGLKNGIARSDAVVHLAFNHDFSRFQQNCEDDRRVIEALGAMLKGSGRPLLITSGTGMTNTAPGQLATEDGELISSAVIPRAASEEAVQALVADGLNASVVRLPQVHDTEKQGLVTRAIQISHEKGACAYIGDGQNRWPAAPLADVARLYRLAIEKAECGARYHAVAEEGVSMRDIMNVLGRRLGLPIKSITAEEAQDWYGWLAMFAMRDLPASGAQTRNRLGWEPKGPTLLADLAELRLA
jgi:nucleoside-diphosphate-sugar epimerase